MTGRGALALVALALAPAPGFGPAARAQAPPAPAAAAVEDAVESREILVMLRMPAPHYRPDARHGGRYGAQALQQSRRRIAARIAREYRLELVDSWPMPLIGVDCYVMRIPDARPVDAVLAQVSRHRLIAWSQPLQRYESLASPVRAKAGDPLFHAQPAVKAWRLADLHDVATGRGIKVAVIDSKVELAHPDLAGQFASSRDFLAAGPGAAEAHGTGIAGIIGARSGNGIGISGIAPKARLMALRACSERPGSSRPSSVCNSLSLAKALHFALEKQAHVINLSLSGPPDPLLASLLQIALDRKTAVVAAFDPRRPGGGFPASKPGVIPVADESLPSVPAGVYRAPGRDIPTTQPGGRWYLVNGSSFAAAHLSGLLALLREERGATDASVAIARDSSGRVDACATLLGRRSSCDRSARSRATAGRAR